MDAATEKIVLTRCREGEEAAFEALVAAHSARIIRLAWHLVGNREDAEDIAQEAFIRLFRGLSSFRGDSSVSTWLHRTVTHLAIDHLRRQKLKKAIFFFRQSNEDPDPVDWAVDPGDSPLEQHLAGETGRLLGRALEKLSVRQRMVFALRHHEDLPLKEIAMLLQLEEGTVKAHLHRAVMVLRKELQGRQGNRS